MNAKMLKAGKAAAALGNQLVLASAAKTEGHNGSLRVVCIILQMVLNPGIFEGVPGCGLLSL